MDFTEQRRTFIVKFARELSSPHDKGNRVYDDAVRLLTSIPGIEDVRFVDEGDAGGSDWATLEYTYQGPRIVNINERAHEFAVRKICGQAKPDADA